MVFFTLSVQTNVSSSRITVSDIKSSKIKPFFKANHQKLTIFQN